jgi:hypothetical protein
LKQYNSLSVEKKKIIDEGILTGKLLNFETSMVLSSSQTQSRFVIPF